jgi:hypothetical protein
MAWKSYGSAETFAFVAQKSYKIGVFYCSASGANLVENGQK